jgi:hypothetical protein
MFLEYAVLRKELGAAKAHKVHDDSTSSEKSTLSKAGCESSPWQLELCPKSLSMKSAARCQSRQRVEHEEQPQQTPLSPNTLYLNSLRVAAVNTRENYFGSTESIP